MNAAGMTITYHIDLDAPQNVVWIGTLLVQGDDSAHKIVAELYRGREKHNPANDVTALGVFVRSDGYAVALGGEIAGNTVTIALDGACYDVAGPCYLSIVLNDQGGERTVLKAAGRVDQDEKNGYIDETVYTSFDALVEAAVNAYLGGSLPEGGGSGTITGPYVSTINGQSGDVTLDAAAVGALPASTQIPGKTSELTNDSGYITKAVADLTNYYLKSETYTREEINQRISQIPKFTISVVTALPASGDATTIYLVGGGISGDLYTEYIWADGAWEILGSQRVDLTGYATETWVSGQLGSYLKASELASAINTALAQAAASGEFDGADGVGVAGVSVTREPDEYGYYYITIELTDGQVQAIPYRNGVDGKDGVSVSHKWSGTTLSVTSASGTSSANLKGDKGDSGYTPVRGVDYYTPADQEAIVQQIIAALGTPVFGRVDGDNNIILTGELAEGRYTLKYEDAEGNSVEIGTLDLSDNEVDLIWNDGYTAGGSSSTTISYNGENIVTDKVPIEDGYDYTLYVSYKPAGISYLTYYYKADGSALGRVASESLNAADPETSNFSVVLSPPAGAATLRINCYCPGRFDEIKSYITLTKTKKAV